MGLLGGLYSPAGQKTTVIWTVDDEFVDDNTSDLSNLKGRPVGQW
jgi:hypothetical protein